MYFWSKGLGKRSHLVIPCGMEKPEDKGDSLALYGRTDPPVVWNYTMTMTESDFLSILELGLSRKFIRFLLHPKRIKYALKLLFLILVMTVKYLFIKPSDVHAYSNSEREISEKQKKAETSDEKVEVSEIGEKRV